MQTKEFQTTSTTECEYTRNFFHQRTLTPMPNWFTPEEIYARFRICLHQEPFTQENLQHEGHFTHLYFTRRISTLEGFYTRTLLRHKAPVYIHQPFTQKTLYAEAIGTKRLWREKTFTPNNFSQHWIFHQKSFAPEAFWHQKPFHRAHVHHATNSHQKENSSRNFLTKEVLQQNPLKPGT